MTTTRTSEIEQLRQQIAELKEMVQGTRSSDIYHVPDPIKQLSEFSGNKKELTIWLDEIDELYETFKTKGENGAPDTMNIFYLRAIKNKITGDARVTLCANGNPNTIPDIKKVLLQHYGDQRDIATNLNVLFSLKKGDRSHHKFYAEMKEIETKIKSNLQLNPLSTVELLEKIVITKYLDNIGEPLASIIRNTNPTGLESAFQSVILNQNAETRTKPFKPKTFNNNYSNNNNYHEKPSFSGSNNKVYSNNKGHSRKQYFQSKNRSETNNNEVEEDKVGKEEENEREEDELSYSEGDEEINFHTDTTRRKPA